LADGSFCTASLVTRTVTFDGDVDVNAELRGLYVPTIFSGEPAQAVVAITPSYRERELVKLTLYGRAGVA